jgi:GMP synthase (glutamine-hydrolysing)
MNNKVAILDFGSQLTHLLATEVRRLKVYSEILDSDTTADQLKDYAGIILSGGPNSVYEEGSPQIDPAIFELGLPILGICYGHQLIVQTLGGKVESASTKEYGKAILHINQSIGVLEDFKADSDTQIWMSHGDDAVTLPEGFLCLASTSDCQNAVIGNPDKKIYSMQFHVEVNHTVEGKKMLASFLKLCKVDYSWNLEGFLETRINELQAEVGDKNVFLMISGGVDSTVAFALLNKAIGSDRVYGLFVDTGFMRKGEVEQVTAALNGIGVTNLHVYSGATKYFEKLDGVFDPEQKRKIIGDLFLDIQSEVSDSLQLNADDWLLGQGTIYPDTIESGGTKNSQKIKTHHNRVARIAELIEAGKVIEPVKDLYKDEVRQIGKLLGLPKAMVERHPFPGPGLAVRCLCSSPTPEKLDADILKQQDEINEFLSSHGLVGTIAEIKSVGVQGDGRTYRHPLIIEFADPAALSNVDARFTELLDLSTALTNQFNKINRVVLSLNPSAISRVKTLPAQYLTPKRIETLQQADSSFNELLRQYGDYTKVWQAPLVLVPMSVEFKSSENSEEVMECLESVILRPISSREAMTADVYQLSFKFISDFVASSQNLAVFYDLTHKPPGTIEWE